MAPVERMSHDELEQQLKDIIQDLYNVMVQVSTYDTAGRPSREVLSTQVKTLSDSLQAVHAAAAAPRAALPAVPPELLEYVDNGRNPDIYTREFVELVRRGNQLMRGKVAAYAALRDQLAADVAAALPELRDDVARVLENTGGRPAVLAVRPLHPPRPAAAAAAAAAPALTTTLPAAAPVGAAASAAAAASSGPPDGAPVVGGLSPAGC